VPDEPTPELPREDVDRLDRLESTVVRLEAEMAAMRQTVSALAARLDGQPAPPPTRPATSTAESRPSAEGSVPFTPAPPRPRPAPPPPASVIDVESLVGRYGTLALATLTILMGIGAFLTWAIANGKLGPEIRVALGAVAAVATAAAGWRLRSRGTTRFGNALLSLALAMIHLDAWAAGPSLQLLPEPVALGVAAIASALLALLAIREGAQSLFVVGVGGAMLAPFVTSSRAGSATVLLAYGLIVQLLGMWGMRTRAWRGAALLLALGTWWYTGASIATVGMDGPRALLTSAAPSLFALACAWGALAIVDAHRAVIAQAALSALAGSLYVDVLQASGFATVPILAAAGTLTAYVTLYDPAIQRGRELIGAAVLPLAMLGAALAWLTDPSSVRGGSIAAGWTVMAVVAAATAGERRRGLHAMTAGIASAAAIGLALDEQPVIQVVVLAAHVVVLSLVVRRLRTKPLVVPIAGVLVAITSWSYDLLLARVAFVYTPFVTSASIAALATSGAWLVFSWNASRTTFADGVPWGPRLGVFVRLGGFVVAFLWGREELRRAISDDVATFLLILYYALVGVAAIGLGRARTIPPLRHAGLALAIFAALKAVVQASALDIGWRVGSYLLAGVFMLGVAYWYRLREQEG
jgi:uncharacterized membrane protein